MFRRTLAALTVVFPLAAGVGGVGGMGGCQTNPATGEMQFLALSREEEIQIGSESAPQMLSEYGGEVPSAPVQQYVSGVGSALASKTEAENPSLPWEFHILNSDVINAFALPGGKVFISRGLVEQMSNEAQLAFVLGHEVGHVTARHVNDRMVEQMKVQLGAAAVGLLISGSESGLVQQAGSALVNVGGQGYLLKFNRDQELQADALGMRYMTMAGYDPVGALQAMQILDEASGGASGLGEWLQTHPYPATRIEKIQAKLSGEFQNQTNASGYEVYEQRFQQQALTPLRKLPKAPAASVDHGDGGSVERLAIGDPRTWCSICADEHGAAH